MLRGTVAVALGVVVAGQVVYHVVARDAAKGVRPFELVATAYFVGLMSVVVAGVASRQIGRGVFDASTLRSGAMLGLGVALVELGYVFAYARGLSISTGALTALTITTLVLVPVGVVVFHDSLTLRRVAGAVIAVVALWLMK